MRAKRFLIATGIAVLGLLSFWFFKKPSFPNSFPSLPPLQLPSPEFLKANLSIEGQVVDSAQNGIAGSWVSAICKSADNPKVASARCDGEGKFKLEGLAKGEYEITASAAGFRPARVTQQASQGAVTIGLQALNSFGAGAAAPANPGPKFSINSRVVRKSGPNTGFAVALIPADPNTPGGIHYPAVANDGIFEIKSLYAGKYKLRVLPANKPYDFSFYYAELDIEIGPDKKPAPTLIEIPVAEIRGIVKTPSAPNIFPPSLTPLPYPGALIKLRFHSGKELWTDVDTIEADQDGKFQFQNLPEGEYEIVSMAADCERLSVAVTAKTEESKELELTLTWKMR